MRRTYVETEAGRALCAWFRTQGGLLRGTVSEHLGLRGIVATRDIDRGELVLRAPRSLFFLAQECHTPLARAVQRTAPGASLLQLAARLLDTREHGGPWGPLVDSLPASFAERPVWWTCEQRAWLVGSDAWGRSRAWWRRARSDYRVLQAALPAGQRVALRDFLWAFQAAWTRNFTLEIDDKPTRTMIPVADMFNHVHDPNCDWDSVCAPHFEVRARRRVPAGTPLTIEYQPDESNASLLAHHGFCVEGNPNDVVSVGVTLSASHWARTLDCARALPAFLHLGRDPLRGDGPAVLSLQRLQALPDAAQAHARASLAGVTGLPMLDAENESAALAALGHECHQRLAEFACGVDVDDALLTGDTLTVVQRNAVIVRGGEKRILEDTIARSREVVAALALQGHARHAALARHAAERGPWGKYFRQLLAMASAV
jgi:hypothetical protein